MDYIYTIRVPFDALDDIEAKEIARYLSKSFHVNEEKDSEVKLQRIHKDKAPEKVNF